MPTRREILAPQASPEATRGTVVAAGDNPHRIKSEAAWAHLCGVACIPASSGKTVRHRLNRGGVRQTNSALYRIVLSRLSGDERTKTYMARRLEEGRTRKEIIRCLKRYVAHGPRVAHPCRVRRAAPHLQE